MHKVIAAIMAAAISLASLAAEEPATAKRLCAEQDSGGAQYVVCRFDAAIDPIRLYHANEEGEAYRHFNFLKDALAENGELLLFAMNAGMYHDDRRPVGLYVEDGETIVNANTNEGPGNFHLLPNGVFYVAGVAAGVMETKAFLESGITADYATQSGPMLVIDGALHPDFLEDSESRKRRNGVGVAADGRTVYFVISDTPVTFYEFASFFRDALQTPNALFLDGTISRLYAPELERNEPGAAMGPIIGVSVRVE